ncbi:MAG: nucleotidyltransferase family protein [Oscillospiraceae bacterium]|jgi:predicted nucleotidyltransferase|nr:nucleotidyltransferase family protein [Oscillospiraceae bacterium]
MPIVGIAAEFNPFHSGHAEHIAATKSLLGGDALVIVVMSGNFVQRGDIAVYGKRARANAAVHCGADLVLELPAAVTLSSASRFAAGAVNLLDALGCVEYLSFGSESGDLNQLNGAVELLNQIGVDERIRYELRSGVSYASARLKALEFVSREDLGYLRQPNNILAVEYLQALRSTNILPLTIQRGNADDTASALRKRLSVGGNIADSLPIAAAKIFEAEDKRGAGPVFIEALERPVLAKLRCMTADDFDALPDATEGLGNRLYGAAQKSESLRELFELTKTKRYAMSRIRRMVLCAFLGIRADDCQQAPKRAAILASGKRGRKIKTALPLVTGSRDGLHEWLKSL